jgi:hypothetical protein
MNIEKQLEDIRDQLNILAAAMEIRGPAYISEEIEVRAKAFQNIAVRKFEQKIKKDEAFKKYMDLKYQILELETDNPEFKGKTL